MKTTYPVGFSFDACLEFFETHDLNFSYEVNGSTRCIRTKASNQETLTVFYRVLRKDGRAEMDLKAFAKVLPNSGWEATFDGDYLFFRIPASVGKRENPLSTVFSVSFLEEQPSAKNPNPEKDEDLIRFLCETFRVEFPELV